MNRLQFSILLSSFVLVLFSTSCFKSGGPCEEALNINNSDVVVAFKNENGDYLYKEINSPYNKDSLKVFDENGRSLVLYSSFDQIPSTSFKFYAISFGPVYDHATDQASFNSEVCKDFFIQYGHNERDTVQTCFKSKKTKCGSVFETLNVYHKGQLLASVNNNVYAKITLIKP